MSLRLKSTLLELENRNLEGLLISSQANITYLTRYPSRDSYLLVSKKGSFYFTDSRYLEEAKTYLKGKAEVLRINGSVFGLIAKTCLDSGLKRIGFEGRELAYAEYEKIQEDLKAKAILISTHGIVETLRQVKDHEEIGYIKKSTAITCHALDFARDFIRPGRKEIEIVGELESFIRYHGARDTAFDIIVASGPNSAFPHHIPGQRKLKDNEPVLIDIGTDHSGYKSDLTRVFFLGKISVLVRKVYRIVLEANLLAIKKIAPGVQIGAIDAAARSYIAKNGYSGYFGHALGHGLGLEVHEAPYISQKQESVLQPGMVFTIEPAIYLPGKFGIRIEDLALVTKKGCDILSGSLNKRN